MLGALKLHLTWLTSDTTLAEMVPLSLSVSDSGQQKRRTGRDVTSVVCSKEHVWRVSLNLEVPFSGCH